jgi:ABC-2 type transport system permease protein
MSGVAAALWYLRVTSARNAIVSRIARLRQPKYLIGGVVGLLYIYYFFLRRFSGGGYQSTRAGNLELPPEALAAFLAIGAAILLLIFLLCWIWPRERAGLNFTEAEIDFLFPAPLSRRSLLNYRLLATNARTLFTAAMFALFSTGWTFLHNGPLIRLIAWWLIVGTLSLHITASAFVITRWADAGVSSLRRQLLMTGAFAVAILAVYLWVRHDLRAPTAADMNGFNAIMHYVGGMMTTGAIGWILLPFKLMLAPLFSTDARSLVIALGPALLIYAVHYLWVLSVETSFEEASIAKARRRAERIAAARAGKLARVSSKKGKSRREPFKLDVVRRPEVAFLWKNLFSTAEYLRPKHVLVAAAVIMVGCSWIQRVPGLEWLLVALTTISLIFGAYLIVLGPQLARQDLRGDLLNTDILKTYPLHGWQVVLGEMLTPIVVVSEIFWLLLLMAAFAFHFPKLPPLIVEYRWGAFAVLALIGPMLIALEVLVVNAAALLFPAWIRTGRSQGGGGIDVMGQRLFFLAGQVVVILVALLPATLVAGGVYFVAQFVVGIPIAAAIATLIIAGILLAEIAAGVLWLGKRFESFDLSDELRP